LDDGGRFWNAFWVVAPLLLGGAIGLYFAAQLPTSVGSDCGTAAASAPTSTNFALAVVLVALIIGRLVARTLIGPVAARAFTLAAMALVVVACGSVVARPAATDCPQPASVRQRLASPDEALVRTAPAQLHVRRYTA
jgi:hypothetical protein